VEFADCWIAQSGRYRPNATGLQNDFAIEGEQRYWLHIAIGRGPTATTNPPTVDVLGTQLEEVTQ